MLGIQEEEELHPGGVEWSGVKRREGERERGRDEKYEGEGW
jgi:hypothetical protein